MFKEALKHWWNWQANSDSFHTRITNFKSHLTTQMPSLYRENLGHKLTTTEYATSATIGSSISSPGRKAESLPAQQSKPKKSPPEWKFSKGTSLRKTYRKLNFLDMKAWAFWIKKKSIMPQLRCTILDLDFCSLLTACRRALKIWKMGTDAPTMQTREEDKYEWQSHYMLCRQQYWQYI